MKRIIKTVVAERKIVLFIALIIAAFGLYNYFVIPKQETPEIKVNAAMITTVYPGATPQDMEQLVTKKIEDAASEVTDCDYAYSTSGKSVSVVIVVYNNDADFDQANRELRDKIEGIKADLPKDCHEPEINTDMTEVAGVMISLSGENYSYEQLSYYAQRVREAIAEVCGIYKTELIGEVEKQVAVHVEADRLNQYGLSLTELSRLIYSQNLEIPNGAIENSTGKIFVQTEALYHSLDDIRNVIIEVSKETGAMVRLKDVASVEMELDEESVRCKEGEQKAVVVAGYFKDDENIIPIGKKVQKALDDVAKSFPPDLKLTEVNFQPDDVKKSTGDFTTNLIIGIILVVIVIFIGMGLRNALVVSCGLPLTIAITFILMNITGVRLEIVSLAGLIIALGMIVDNAVVINDAIEVRYAAGESKEAAAVNAASAVAAPVFSSTLTTVAAFVPLLFIPGDVGQFIASLPKTVIYALIASFISAVFVVPALLSLVIKRKEEGGEEKDGILKIKGFFMSLLKPALQRKAVTLGVAAALLVLTVIVVIPQLKVTFFPKADRNLLYIDADVEKVGNLKYTAEVVDRISRSVLEEPEILSITSGIGTSMPKVFLTMIPFPDQENVSRSVVRFDLKKSDRFKTKNELAVYLQEKLDARISGAVINLKLLELADPGNAAVGIRLYGEDLNRLREVSLQMEKVLQDCAGTININSDASESSYEYAVEVDQEKAALLGIANTDIQTEIQTALFGSKEAVYREEGREYEIKVKSDIASVHELGNLAIKSSLTGKKVLLKQIAVIKPKPQIDSIKRYEKERSILVSCDVKTGYSPVDIENTVEKEYLPGIDLAGVELVFEGEREQIDNSFSNLGVLGIFILLFLYIILLVEFRSFLEPIIILTTVPLSLIGSMLGLLIFKKPLSFTALLGVVSLMGIVVNNAILLLDYIKSAEKQGYAGEEACLNAVSMRFRPIMLTTVTTLMGLVPLAFSGSELFSPLAVALMSGLLVSTFLTMIVIPVIYVSLGKVVQKIKTRG